MPKKLLIGFGIAAGVVLCFALMLGMFALALSIEDPEEQARHEEWLERHYEEINTPEHREMVHHENLKDGFVLHPDGYYTPREAMEEEEERERLYSNACGEHGWKTPEECEQYWEELNLGPR